MLLHPFEEQLDLPAIFVKSADCCRRQREVVGEEHQRLSGFRVLETDAPQMVRVVSPGIEAVERNRLIADDTGAAVCLCGVQPVCVEVRLGAGDEECSRQMQAVQAREIHVAPIHHVDGTRLRHQQVERVNVVHLAVGNVDEAGDVAAQVQQGVHLHRRLGGAEMRPGKQRQAQVYGGRVQRIDGIGQVQPEVFAGIQLPCLHDQSSGEIGVNAPVAQLVGIGQRGAGHRLADAHVVELVRLCEQADFDVAQALAIGELGESQDAEMLGTGQHSDAMVAAIPIHDAMKSLPWQEV